MISTNSVKRVLALLSATHARRIVATLTLVSLFVTTLLTARWYRWNYVPIAHPTASIPDAAKVGDVEAAKRQCQELYALLRENGGDMWATYRARPELLFLRDRRFAEDQGMREKKVISFVFPRPDGPLAGSVAFYSEIYARNNPMWYRGERTTTAPSGFYLVCWQDGRVSTVPVEDVRVQLREGGGYFPVFPGVEGYDPDGYRLPWLELKDGKIDTEREKTLLAGLTSKEDCPGCAPR